MVDSPQRTESQRAVEYLLAERRGDRNIEALTASILSIDLTRRGITIIHFVTLAVSLNVD